MLPKHIWSMSDMNFSMACVAAYIYIFFYYYFILLVNQLKKCFGPKQEKFLFPKEEDKSMFLARQLNCLGQSACLVQSLRWSVWRKANVTQDLRVRDQYRTKCGQGPAVMSGKTKSNKLRIIKFRPIFHWTGLRFLKTASPNSAVLLWDSVFPLWLHSDLYPTSGWPP